MNEFICMNSLDNGYMRIEIVRNLEELKVGKYQGKSLGKELLKNCEESSSSAFFQSLIDFEGKKTRKYKNSDYEARFGYLFTCLLPSGNNTDARCKKLAAIFAKKVIQKEKGLKYVVWKKFKGKGVYLNIYISDREQYDHVRVKTYKANIYRNKYSKVICGATDEDAELVCKKGDPIRDKNGNVIAENKAFKDRKSRRFCFKEENQECFYQTFRELWVQSIKKVLKNIKEGLLIRRHNLKKAKNRFIKRSIVAVNLLMQIIQSELNNRIWESQRYPDAYEIEVGLYHPSERIQTSQTKKWVELFERYRKYFASQSFTKDDVDYSIALTERCDRVEKNVQVLKEMFMNDLKALEI